MIYYCNTNKKLLKLCSSEKFWASKLNQLPMPTIDMTLSMWLYHSIIKIDQWLNSKDEHITLYYNEIGDEVMSLILKYEMDKRSFVTIRDKNDKVFYLKIRRRGEKYYVSVFLQRWWL